MNRRIPVVAAIALVATGVLASACDVTPPAATANGTTISASALNTQLAAYESTAFGACLLQLNDQQLAAQPVRGAGGPGTYTMAFTDAVLKGQLGDLIVEQYATSRGITISAGDLGRAQTDLEALLSGEASSAVQQSSAAGTLSPCEDSGGNVVTGAQLLGGVPGSVRDAQVRSEAVDERLLAMGADLSDAAVTRFYAANQAQFTNDCVSVIASDTQQHAQQLAAQLDAGASFADVARASSLDAQTAPNGGSLGCNITQSRVEQALQVQSTQPGKPIGPMQDQSTGRWMIYEVTSQSLEPLDAAKPVIRQELLRTTQNIGRVQNGIVGFARRSQISVDPEYGTWRAPTLTIVPPKGPPDSYLLPAAPTASTTPGAPSAVLGGAGTG